MRRYEEHVSKVSFLSEASYKHAGEQFLLSIKDTEETYAAS